MRYALLLFLACCVTAAEPPRISYIYPAGAQQGTTVEIEIGGQRVMDTTAVYVNGGGVSASLLSSKEDPDAEKKKGGKRKNIIEGRLKVAVTVAADATPGMRGLWLASPTGISNSLAFVVGQIPEVREIEPAAGKPPTEAMRLPALPVAVNGQITPGDIDRFSFTAKTGQRLVARVDARTLVPYLADTVPGWFQAVLTLFDANGKEIAYVDDYRFNPDPVMFFDVPADGTYTIEIRDALYRGREDFTYRIALGELPHITDVFPLGATRGGMATVQLAGRNLPADTLRLTVRGDGPLLQPVQVERAGLRSNAVPFTTSDLPETLARTGDGQVQEVGLPIIVNGRLQAPGDTDWFRFAGTKGQNVVVEVLARRLGSPLDSIIALLDAQDRILAENDDYKEDGEGLMTHHADSLMKCTLPADGTYRVRLRDAQGKGGDAFAYRLRISEPRPSFALRAVPAAVAVPRNGSASFTVHVLRLDGYSGPIDCALEGAPAGLTLEGGRIGAGANHAVLTLSAGTDLPTGMAAIRMTGTGSGDQPWHAPVVPAEDLMQAFYYHHLVPAAAQLALVVEPAKGAITCAAPPSGGTWELPRGKEVDLAITIARQPGFDAGVQLTLVDPPKGVSMRRGFIPIGKDSGPVTIRIETKNEAAPEFSLVFTGTAYVPVPGETTADGKERKVKVTFTGKAIAVRQVEPPKPPPPAKPQIAAKPKVSTDKPKPATPPVATKVVIAPAKPEAEKKPAP